MIAVIGCGYWGKNLIRNFSQLGVLSSVCDHDPKKAQEFAETYGVKSQTIEDMMGDPTIEAVVIAAAPRLNAHLSLQALEAKKHVFVEKPYAFDQETADQIAHYLQTHSSDKSQVFMVGHLLLYHGAFLKVKELAKAGMVGDIREIRCVRHGLGRVRKEYGVLWELAPHDLSMILDLDPGHVRDIQVLSSSSLTGQQDTIRVRYKFSDGITALISCSWAEPVKAQQFIIQGTRGYLIFDDTKGWDEKVQLIKFEEPMDIDSINHNHYQVEKIPLNPEEVLKIECAHFVECIQEAKMPVSHHDQARLVFDLLLQTQNLLDRAS